MSLKFFGRILAFTAILVLIGISIWNYQSRNIYEKQKTEISDIIRNVVSEQASKNMLLPQIVFINADSIDKQKLNEKFIAQITQSLTERYLKSDSSQTILNISPILSSPFIRNNQGQYFISEAQANQFKTNIEFLIKQTDNQVASVKDEIGKDIDRLNMWVSIWIGFIGLLGIFIPIVINIDAKKELEKINKNAEDAKTSANEAQKKMDEATPQIEKIAGLEQVITTAQSNMTELNKSVTETGKKAEAANAMAKEAKKNSGTLHLVYAVDRLELVNLAQFKRTEKNELYGFLILVLKKIHKDLNDCSQHCQELIVKQSLNEMAWRLQEVSLLKYIDSDATSAIMNFVKEIEELMKSYSSENYQGMIAKLDSLIDQISGKSTVVA